MSNALNHDQDLLQRRPLPLVAIRGVTSGALVAAERKGESPRWGIESVAPCLLLQPFGYSIFTFLFTRMTVAWCCGFRDGEPQPSIQGNPGETSRFGEQLGSPVHVTGAFGVQELGSRVPLPDSHPVLRLSPLKTSPVASHLEQRLLVRPSTCAQIIAWGSYSAPALSPAPGC